ncbi:MAG: type II toxin-antitoxin system VapC family toxin [Dehalococcoidia bacterium]
MLTYYLDTSAAAKPYFAERGAEWVTSLTRSDAIVISVLSVVELASAVARRVRDRDLSAEQGRLAHETFLRHARRFEVVDLTQQVIDRASRILLASGSSGLRTLDALHLASAQQSFILLRDAGQSELILVAANKRLRDAAAAAGLSVENPEDHA